MFTALLKTILTSLILPMTQHCEKLQALALE
jgi:hypothetical protein